MLLRQTTNLVVSPDLTLNKTELQSSFMHFYSKKYKGTSVLLMSKIWLACVFPQITKNPKFNLVVNTWVLKSVASYKLKKINAGYLRVQKITNSGSPHFEVSLPVYTMRISSILEEAAYLDSMFNEGSLLSNEPDLLVREEAIALAAKISNRTNISGNSYIDGFSIDRLDSLNLDVVTKLELSKTFAGVDLVAKGDLIVVYLILKINSSESEQLTNTPWLEIRNIDMYPLLMAWVMSYYGFKEKAPLASFPISLIAKTLPAVQDSSLRVNSNNLTISSKGIPLYIPKVLNNTSRYEDLFAIAGTKEDGSFSLLTIDVASEALMHEREPKIYLPANIPVLIDWTNNKYSYTSTSGLMVVQDLSKCRIANVTHIVKLLDNTELTTKLLIQFMSLASFSGSSIRFNLTVDELNQIINSNFQGLGNSDEVVRIVGNGYDISDYFNRIRLLYIKRYSTDDVTAVINMSMVAVNSEYLLFRPVARFIQAAHASILNSLDVIYSNYSVSYVSHTFALITLIAKYSDDLESLRLTDAKNRSAAINQWVDPNWESPSIPLLGEHVGRLPHQLKVANVIKEQPEFSILKMEAGSGKTITIIIDILLEIQNNSSNPYLIMCPSALVSQYLKEIAFFTKGKLNAIAINSYTINHNGFERLTAIIQSAPINTVVVCSYDVLSFKQSTVCYGTHSINIFPVIEFLRQFKFQYFAADECFIAGTLIDTPTGKVKIEDIKINDFVLSAVGPQKVEYVSVTQNSDDLIKVTYNGDTQTCTKNHPFFTSNGWVLAKDIKQGDLLAAQTYSENLLNEDLRTLPTTLRTEKRNNSKSTFLRDILCSEVENDAKTHNGQNTQSQSNTKKCSHKNSKTFRKSRRLRLHAQRSLQSYESEQPFSQLRYSRKNAANLNKNRTSIFYTRREWYRSESMRTGSNEHVSESNSSTSYNNLYKTRVWNTYALQGRPSLAKVKSSIRNTGKLPQSKITSWVRRKEKESIKFFRVESVVCIKQNSFKESKISKTVYNLQVAGHPSYSVNGALVHNCHYLKNKSSRSTACMSLITDIPKKRLASGTMVHDSPSDLAMQIAILDPTLFGLREDFNEKYGQEIKNDRVIYWKPQAQLHIMNAIKSRIVVASAVRKEWVALLPEVKEMFHKVELTQAQQAVYGSILEETLVKITEEAKTNKGLAKFIASTGKIAAEDSDEEFEDLSAMLTPYLARLEQFITAPSRDILGSKLLTEPSDAISPKVVKVVEIIRSHLDNKVEGKILIFTNYVASAEDIYDKLPPDLQMQTVLYTASNKVEASSMFETDDSYKIMVGVEQSMNTGVNLQFASNLIRIEAVWNPGTEEQGNSRVNRPELKTIDRRTTIYFNRVICNKTIDVTKVSRLISKIVAKVKFDNADNNLYDSLADVPIIPMTLESIQSLNNWDLELVSYATVYAKYKAIQKVEYAEYKEKHGAISLHPVSHSPDPVGSMLLAEVPYSPGLELAGSDELKLVRLDQFLRSEELGSSEETESEALIDIDDSLINNESTLTETNVIIDFVTRQRRMQDNSLRGTSVHTEFGDGLIRVLMNNSMVSVDLHTGNRISCKRSSVFVITEPSLIVTNVRQQLLELIGLPITQATGIASPLAKLDTLSFKRSVALKELAVAKYERNRLKNQVTVNLQLFTSNGYLGISYFSTSSKNDKGGSVLLAMNFRNQPSFKYAAIEDLDVLAAQCRLWKLKGLALDKRLNKANMISNGLRDMYNLFYNNEDVSNRQEYKYSLVNKLPNFYTLDVRPSADSNAFKLFPIIENGNPYLMLPTLGQTGTKTAMKYKVAGINWKTSELSLVYFNTILKVKDKIKEIVNAGIIIENMDEIKMQYKKLKNQKFRNE